MRIVVRCPDLGISERSVVLDGTAIRAAAADVVVLWPWAPPPEMDQGGTGMIALQDMLMQTYGNESRTIRLVPAWPEDWTAEFKMRAPFETTLEGRVENGEVVALSVDPPELLLQG